MVKIDKHIEIVRTNRSELSSMSQVSCDAIFAMLSKHYTRVGVTTINGITDLDALVIADPDLVFLGMKFLPLNPALGLQDTNKIWLADYLDEHNISYTGSRQTAHELELDKPLAKQSVLNAGLCTSPFYVSKQRDSYTDNQAQLAYPLFIKPTNRGGGLGIDSDSVARNSGQLQAKVQALSADLQSDSLVEEYLPGREFSVAILKDEHSTDFSVMPLELIAPLDHNGERLLSEQVKSSDTERFTAVTDELIKTQITALAINVFYALGARDYGRIDIRLDKAGIPHFLEANLIPSLIQGYGNFPKACLLNINMDYELMLLTIVRLGLARNVLVVDDVLVEHAIIAPVLEPVLEIV